MNRVRLLMLMCLVAITTTAQTVPFLEGNPVWCYTRANYPVNWEALPYDKEIAESYGLEYYDNGTDKATLKYVENPLTYEYYFVDGKEELNGKEYSVIKSFQVCDTKKAFDVVQFRKELLVREENGKVLADAALFSRYLYEKVCDDAPLDIWYNREGDEVVVYDFNLTQGCSVGESNHIASSSTWTGLDGKVRRMQEFIAGAFGRVVEGIGMIDNPIAGPFIPAATLVEPECLNYDINRYTLNQFCNNGNTVYKAPQLSADATDSEEIRLHKIATSYSEPPCLAELQEYLAKKSNEEPATTCDFIKAGKSWKIIGFANGHPYVSGIEPEYDYTLCFPEDSETIVGGRAYYAMHKMENSKDAVVALFREENDKVYIYDDKQGSEYLYYDFTLEEGDEFELKAPHGEGKMMCKVTSVEQVKYYNEVRKKLTFDAFNEQDKDNPIISHNVWIEGIGNPRTPIENCQDANWEGAPDLFTAYTYCTEDEPFFPLRIDYPYYYGQGIESFAHRDVSGEDVPDLAYKFEGDTLHVYGELYTACGSALYLWLTGNPDTKELQMSVENVGIVEPCMGLHRIDLKFPGFYEDGTYTIKDYTGTHSVVKGATAHFSPLITKNKAWHVTRYSDRQLMFGNYSNGAAEEYDLCFAQDNDTVINGQSYHKLTYLNSKENGEGHTAAILREEQGKVYKWNGTDESLFYDFTLEEGDETEVADMRGAHKCKVKNVGTVWSNGVQLKTITLTTTFSYPEMEEEDSAESEITWIESFGTASGPLYSFTDPYEEGQSLILSPYAMIGDETYIPLAFELPMFHGQQLVIDEDVSSDISEEEWGRDNLSYEFIDDNTLRIHGTMWTTCSPNQYIYLFVEWNGNIGEYQVSTRVEELAPFAECMGAHEIDLRFHDFFPEGKYFFPGTQKYLTIPSIPNGISTHAVNSAASGIIYDLTGRRLSKAPKKGIYIEEGKLRIR